MSWNSHDLLIRTGLHLPVRSSVQSPQIKADPNFEGDELVEHLVDRCLVVGERLESGEVPEVGEEQGGRRRPGRRRQSDRPAVPRSSSASGLGHRISTPSPPAISEARKMAILAAA